MRTKSNQRGLSGSLTGLLATALLSATALVFASSFEAAPARVASTTARQPATLGTYPDTSLPLSTNATVVPDAAPANTTSINVSTSTSFMGTLAGDPTTGVVRVTDPHPAGTYTITVKAFNGGSLTAAKTFTLTVTTPATCPVVNFTKANFDAGGSPWGMAVGDFNRDGKQDIVVTNAVSYFVTVRLGNGAGGFGNPSYPFAGSGARSVAVGDFNGDGKQDLVTANYLSNNVSILLGNGAGNFPTHVEFSVDMFPNSVAVGDFNGDGKQDLATANYGSNNVSILLGDGTGNFSAAVNLGAAVQPFAVAVGDFNRDGKQDLVVVNQGSDNVSILLGDGAGQFSAAVNFTAGAQPLSVAVGDFNNDGKQDLAVANGSSSCTGDVSILLGDGQGNFSGPTNFGAGHGPDAVAVGDFNGDGKQDLAVGNACSEPGLVSILFGDGVGQFSAPINFVADIHPLSVAVGDFNGDSMQDIAVTNYISNDVSILLRSCELPSPTPTATATATATATSTATPAATPTPTVTATPPCPSVITQSTSQSVSDYFYTCVRPPPHLAQLDSHYWRAFNIGTLVGATQYDISSVSFGVNFAQDGASVTLRLYANNGAAFPSGNRAQISERTISLTNAQSGTIMTLPLAATVPAGTNELVMELFTPFGLFFYPGANTAPETGFSYWNCMNDPPQVIGKHLVFNIYGSCPATSTPTPTPTLPPLIVTNTNDNGPGSLRQALADAQDSDTIQFDPVLNGQSIQLSTGELVVDKNIIIDGPGAPLLAVTRSLAGAPAFRIFHIMPGRVAIIRGLTISHGVPPGGGVYNEAATLTIDGCTLSFNRDNINAFNTGGAILTNGTLTVVDTTIKNNRSQSDGGGVRNLGTLTVLNSTISDNMAAGDSCCGQGGGIFNAGTLTVVNSTLSNNEALIAGGGIYNGGMLTIDHSTISRNSSSYPAAAGAIHNGGTLAIGNTILTTGMFGPNIIAGSVTSLGNNLSSDNGGGFLTGPGDQMNIDPILGPLQDNGGPTSTHALLPGSPAIDMGNPNFNPPPFTDQRGYLRVYNGRIDIGSFEVQPEPTPTPSPPPTATATATATFTPTATATATIPPTPTLTPTPPPCTLTEGFENITTLIPNGWVTQNNSQPAGPAGWFQGNPYENFAAQSGSFASSIAANFLDGSGLAIISNWLLTPPVTLQNGAKFSFWTTTVPVSLFFPDIFPDRLQVRMSTNGTSQDVGSTATSVGDFTTLLLDVNPTYTTTGYPAGWTNYLVTLSGIPSPVQGRLAFRYFVENGGPSGANSNHIGIDTVAYYCNGTIPTPTPATPTPTPSVSPTPGTPVSSIAGTILICSNPLPNVRVNVTGAVSRSDLSDGSGNYWFRFLPYARTYTVTPAKAPVAPGANGIGTTDVIAIQRHYLNIFLIPPGCRLTAADVNADTVVNTVDVIAVQRFFLGLTTGLANVGKYQFTPANRTYTGNGTNWTGENYDTVLVGDVAAPFVP